MLKVTYAQLDQATPLFFHSSSQSPWFDQNYEKGTYIFFKLNLPTEDVDRL